MDYMMMEDQSRKLKLNYNTEYHGENYDYSGLEELDLSFGEDGWLIDNVNTLEYKQNVFEGNHNIEMTKKTGKRLSDDEFDAAVALRLRNIRDHHQPDMSPAEMNTAHYKLKGNYMSNRYVSESVGHMTQINKIGIIQPRITKTSQLPEKSNIEVLAGWCNCTVTEADAVQKCYKLLGLGFKEQKHFNNIIRKRAEGIEPCETPIPEWWDRNLTDARSKILPKEYRGLSRKELYQTINNQIDDDTFIRNFPINEKTLLDLALEMQKLKSPVDRRVEIKLAGYELEYSTDDMDSENIFDSDSIFNNTYEASSYDAPTEYTYKYSKSPLESQLYNMEPSNFNEIVEFNNYGEYVDPVEEEDDGEQYIPQETEFTYYHVDSIKTNKIYEGNYIGYAALIEAIPNMELSDIRAEIFAGKFNYKQGKKLWKMYYSIKQDLKEIRVLTKRFSKIKNMKGFENVVTAVFEEGYRKKNIRKVALPVQEALAA